MAAQKTKRGATGQGGKAAAVSARIVRGSRRTRGAGATAANALRALNSTHTRPSDGSSNVQLDAGNSAGHAIDVRALIERNAALKARAANFRNLWEECSSYIIPRKGQIVTHREEGSRASDHVLDTTAEEALLIFAAGLLQYVTPPGEIWARIEEQDPVEGGLIAEDKARGRPIAGGVEEQAEDVDPFAFAGDAEGRAGDQAEQQAQAHNELARWFEIESEGLMRELHTSNFYLAIHEAFISLGAFGTCCVHLSEADQSSGGGLNFREAVVGSFAVAEDSKGQIDTVFREWKWTAAQAVQEWGAERMGKQVLAALTSRDVAEREREFTFIHAVYSRANSVNPVEQDSVRPGLVEGPARPWASIYVCVEDERLIMEDGYYEMPYAVCRLLKSNGEVYGRGPGIQILPNLRLINRMEYDGLLAIEKAVNPSVLMPDDASFRPDNRPGGITYWDASNPLSKPEWVESRAQIDLNEEKMEQIRERINRAWFVPMFHALNNAQESRRQKTAFEVEQMLQEKMADFSPMFARITEELLGPLLERAFALRVRSGRASAPPESLEVESLDYRITYTGEIALRIKAAQDKGTLQAINLIGQLAQFDPSLIKLVRWSDRLREMLHNMGVPARDILSKAEFEAVLSEQAQAEQEARALVQAQAFSGAVKDMGPDAQALAAMSVADGDEGAGGVV